MSKNNVQVENARSNQNRRKRPHTFYALLVSLIEVVSGFAYLWYFASPLPSAFSCIPVVLIVLAASMVAGYVIKDAATAFATAAISALSLSLSSQVLIVKNLMGSSSGPAPVIVFPGGDLLAAAFSSLMLALCSGMFVTLIVQSLLLKGSLSGRIRNFGSPVVSVMDRHPWLGNIVTFILGILVTIITIIFFQRR